MELRGVDLEGTTRRLGQGTGTRAVVIAFLATECPISNGCIPALNEIAAAGTKNGVEVYGVHAVPGLTRTAANQHSKEFDVRFPILFDASGELRTKLAPTHTPHAFLLTREGVVQYNGAIDNRYSAVGRKALRATENYLQDALSATLSSKAIATPAMPPIGCLLESASTDAAHRNVTYSRDVAPILFTNCVGCHRPGQSAPFSLLSYEDAARHARQIAEVTRTRQMPPWKAVPGFAHFKDERRLSDCEIATLAAWADAGKPQGDPADLPPIPSFSNDWRLGKPDLILKVPQAFELPAQGNDRHQHFVLNVRQTENRLVSAVEFRPGNPRIVHHACFYLDNTGAARKLDAADAGPGYGGNGGAGFAPQSTLRSWLPGITPRRLPDGSGRLMMKGSDLVLELHYQCSGKVETDQSTVGLYFAPKKARQLVGEMQILNYALDIPAGEKWHKHSATYTLPAEAILLDCAPHMHLLGKEMKATATCPDGRVVPLVWVKDWNYLWQEQYEYVEPVRLPKGTRIDVDAWYDNSPGNPLNPYSPPRRVTWGEQTKEEMGICHFQYTCDRADDLLTITRHYNEYRAAQAATPIAGRK
jgi:mono/diheme cytochrome c family protein